MLAGGRRRTASVEGKALLPTVVVVGTVTRARAEQPRKAPSSMEVRPAGRVTREREGQQ